jgi:hypothetical protein
MRNPQDHRDLNTKSNPVKQPQSRPWRKPMVFASIASPSDKQRKKSTSQFWQESVLYVTRRAFATHLLEQNKAPTSDASWNSPGMPALGPPQSLLTSPTADEKILSPFDKPFSENKQVSDNQMPGIKKASNFCAQF